MYDAVVATTAATIFALSGPIDSSRLSTAKSMIVLMPPTARNLNSSVASERCRSGTNRSRRLLARRTVQPYGRSRGIAPLTAQTAGQLTHILTTAQPGRYLL